MSRNHVFKIIKSNSILFNIAVPLNEVITSGSLYGCIIKRLIGNQLGADNLNYLYKVLALRV